MVKRVSEDKDEDDEVDEDEDVNNPGEEAAWFRKWPGVYNRVAEAIEAL